MWRENSLSLFFGAIFLITLAFQSLAGLRVENEELQAHGMASESWLSYVTSSSFGQAVLENWQSEYLQFLLYIVATVYLIQRGSSESKTEDETGLGSDEQARVGPYADPDSPRWARVRGWRRTVYSHSLALLMAAIFILSWFGQSVTGWREFNEEQQWHRESTIGWLSYLGRPDFWESTLQNWQSEFLAVGSMAAFSVYLRQRGSPESKAVGAPHTETGGQD